jgi:hypothetical protein
MLGVVRRCANGDIYEGGWVDWKKHGDGNETSVRACVPISWASQTKSLSPYPPACFLACRTVVCEIEACTNRDILCLSYTNIFGPRIWPLFKNQIQNRCPPLDASFPPPLHCNTVTGSFEAQFEYLDLLGTRFCFCALSGFECLSFRSFAPRWFAVRRCANGSIYDGKWADDKKNGHGEQTSVRACGPNNWESKTEPWSSHAPTELLVSNDSLRQGSVFKPRYYLLVITYGLHAHRCCSWTESNFL